MTLISRIAAWFAPLPAPVLAPLLAVLLAVLATPVPAQPAAPQAPVFVLNSLDASVSVIDPVTWKRVGRDSCKTQQKRP